MKLRNFSMVLTEAVLLTGMAAAQRPVTFMGPSNFGSGTAMSMAMADFNGDGNLDVATAGSDVVVYLGDGRGSFVAQPGIGIAGTSVVAADFNGDRIPDLAVASAFGFYVLLGNGDGTFGAPVFYTGNTIYLVLGDFNGDGYIDIAALAYRSNQLQVFFGAANGTFQPGPVTTLPTGTPLAMLTADFNQDGKADLALTISTASSSGEIAVLFGSGDGTFGSAALYPVTGFLEASLASADFNGDGAPDLAYINTGFGTVDVLLNNGAGNFGAPIATAVATTNLISLAVADLNGDGIPDVLAGSSGLGTVLFGVGNGTFKLGGQFALAYYPVMVGIGDFNHDGVPDVASVNNAGTGTGLQPPFTVVLGAGRGKFQSARAFNTGGSPGQPALGDFNGDGKLDVAVVNYSFQSTTSIAVLFGDGDGDLGPPTLYPADNPTAIAASDVNDDGKLDLVVLEDKRVVTMPGNGDGTFGKPISSACPGCSTRILLVADFNHDGIPDVVTSVFLNLQSGSLGILLGNGDGTFQPPVAYGMGGLSSVAAADFNHDGNLDLVATFSDSGAYIFMGNGDGTFGAPMPLNSEATYAMTADLNKDGNADIVINYVGLGIYLGHGNGTFSAPISVGAQFLTPTLLAGDFSGDGFTDLLGGAEYNAFFTGFSEIVLDAGGAHFTVEKQQFPIGGAAMAAGDFNGDGKLDIASAGPNDTVWIILNTTGR
jgi:hypothetical protein